MQDNGTVLIENLSSRVPAFFDRQDVTSVTRSLGLNERITMPTLSPLPAGEQTALKPPFLLVVGTSAIQIESSVTHESCGSLTALADVAPSPTYLPEESEAFPSFFETTGETKDRDSVLKWLQRTMIVFQQSASNADFLPKAAQAIIDTVGLDMAGILTYDDGEWNTKAVATREAGSEASWRPSKTILNEVLTKKRTYRQLPDIASEAQSLANVTALVVAPMIDNENKVCGAVYADRRVSATSKQGEEISELEAKLVELLACAVAAGLARLEQEQAAAKARVRFEQFFTPQLSQELEADPTLLEGRDAEISLLFGDIVGFSRISERLGPGATVSWVNSVMDAMSELVIEESGVLVDFIGDELFAMWGAPTHCEDHAIRACRTALNMQRALIDLDQQWRDQIGEETRFGIGINTGIARRRQRGLAAEVQIRAVGQRGQLGEPRARGDQVLANVPANYRGHCRETGKGVFTPPTLQDQSGQHPATERHLRGD